MAKVKQLTVSCENRRGTLAHVVRVRSAKVSGMALRVTPAMEAGITDHVWTIEEILDKVGLK